MIHGWQSSPKAIHRVAAAIQAASSRVQVLELDWSEAAADLNAAAVALRVADVGAFAAKKLAAWGIAGANINLVGHSFGGYMTDEIARRMSGGVNRLVALDAAAPVVAGIDISNTNFAAHSKYSVAFVGSNYARPERGADGGRDDHARRGQVDKFATHTNVRELFATMVEQNNGRGDAISGAVLLKAHGVGAARGFRHDGLGNGYKATSSGRTSTASGTRRR